MQRGEAWRQLRGKLDVVEPGDGKVLGHADAALAAFEHRAEGEQVVATHQRSEVEAFGALEQFAQRGAPVSQGKRRLDDAPVRLQATGGKGLAHAGEALAGAVVAGGVAREHGELLVPELEEVLRDLRRCETVGKPDAVPVATRVERPGEFARHAGLLDRLEQFALVVRADQHEPVHAALQQRARDRDLGVGRVIKGGEEQRVARRGEFLRDRLGRAGEDRVVHSGQHGADGARAPRGQRARRTMRHVAQARRGLLDLFARVVAHDPRLGQCAGGGGQRDPGGTGDIGEAGGGFAHGGAKHSSPGRG